ncbi:hypothetical protein C8T65DRAFT_703815 [Cerioporus squamosus]|nr:hypothetical protein C8T65DRAFT_703815 [Cerioporus squamosus]
MTSKMHYLCDANGCDFTTSSTSVFGQHHETLCKYRTSTIKSLLKKRKQQDENVCAWKQAQLERQRQHELLVNPTRWPTKAKPPLLIITQILHYLQCQGVGEDDESASRTASRLTLSPSYSSMPATEPALSPSPPLPPNLHLPSPSPPPSPAHQPAPYVEDTEDEDDVIGAGHQSDEESKYECEPDGFGVFHRYFTEPKENPDGAISLEDHCNAPRLTRPAKISLTDHQSISWLWLGCIKGVTNPHGLCHLSSAGSAHQEEVQVRLLLHASPGD